MSAITSKVFYYALVMLVFMAAAPVARAAPLNQVQLLTELMIESQGDNAGYLGLMFGPDASSPLVFSSNVDPSGTTFSFSLNPGTTYQGQSLTLSGSGVFDPSTSMLTASSSGMLGSKAWTTSDSETVISNGDKFSVASDSNLFDPAAKAFDRHRITDLFSDGISVNAGFYTDKDGKKIPGSDFTSTDTWKLQNPDAGNWQYAENAPGLGFTVASQGFSPINGGAGSFTASVVPEPSASLLFLGGLGMLWLTFTRRKFFDSGEGRHSNSMA